MPVNNFKNKNLLIISSGYPDEENILIRSKFVKNQVDELKKYFHEVHVISPISPTHRFSEVGHLSHNYQYDNVYVYFPYAFYIPLSMLHAVPIDFRLHAVKSVIEKYNLRFDMVHAHMSEPSGYIAMKLKEQYNVPYVLTIHENGIWFEKEIAMQHPKVIDSWKSADALIRVNPNDIPLLKEYNPNAYYIANGYSPLFHPMEMQTCREQLSIPQSKKVFFSLGILTERKGFQFLIEAMNNIVQKRNDVLCYIGGSGPYRQHLEELIRQFHLDEVIFLLGRLSDGDLPKWMNACDAFVLPSLNESFGVVNIEALACGKPVVASNVGGIPEIICSEEYGMLCEAGNVGDLLRAIMGVLEKEWDKTNILKYAQTYAWSEICQEIQSVYGELISEHKNHHTLSKEHL